MAVLLAELDYPDPMPWLCGCCASLGGLFLLIVLVTVAVYRIRRDGPAPA
jgi:hypothetical protein